jgi:hypothetical protein
MPKPKAIYDYWTIGLGKNTLLEKGIEIPEQFRLGDDVKRSEKVLACFACGDHEVQRCHIFPLTKGGTNTVENLHLLCPSCHVESELLVGDLYWRWLKYQFDTEWEPFTEHIHQRRVKLGYDEKEFFRLLNDKEIDKALEYAVSFIGADSEEERKRHIELIKKKVTKFSEG